MKFLVSGFMAFALSYMFLLGTWSAGGATWITIIGIGLTARFIMASVIAFLVAWWMG